MTEVCSTKELVLIGEYIESPISDALKVLDHGPFDFTTNWPIFRHGKQLIHCLALALCAYPDWKDIACKIDWMTRILSYNTSGPACVA